MKVKVRDEDLGYKNVLDNFKRLNLTVEAGYFRPDKRKDGTDQVLVAAVQEFGTTNAGRGGSVTIPATGFMRKTVDEKGKKWLAALDKPIANAITTKSLADVAAIGAMAGNMMAEGIKDTIRKGGFPTNKPSTLKKKQGLQRLRDTDQMLEAPKFKVMKRRKSFSGGVF